MLKYAYMCVTLHVHIYVLMQYTCVRVRVREGQRGKEGERKGEREICTRLKIERNIGGVGRINIEGVIVTQAMRELVLCY